MDYFSKSKKILPILLIFLVIFQLGCGYDTFVVSLTPDQYAIQFQAYIAEFNGKKCYNRPGYDPDTCVRYCQYMYDYVLDLPYKNAQKYNTKTKQCEAKAFCPTGLMIYYFAESNTCKDILYNKTVPFIDAPVPTYNQTTNVTIVCQYGKVTTFMGRTDCQCDFGWGSLPVPNFSSSKAILKCNQPIPLAALFPNFMKIYYDQSYDNMFPYGGDPDYWGNAIQYYIREVKYMVVEFFFPLQVQIVVLIIPCEPIFRPKDAIWLAWFIVGVVILLIFSLFQKCVLYVNKNVAKE